MVMSINEQIAALEEELGKIKGPGSKEKRKDLQAKITALKEEDKPEEGETVSVSPNTPVKNQDDVIPRTKGLPPYRPASMQEIQNAEQAGKLCGVDFKAMTASIKD